MPDYSLKADRMSLGEWRNPPGHVSRTPEETIALVGKMLVRADEFPHAAKLVLSDIAAIIQGRI